jgi:hypothetical protein
MRYIIASLKQNHLAFERDPSNGMALHRTKFCVEFLEDILAHWGEVDSCIDITELVELIRTVKDNLEHGAEGTRPSVS